MYFSNCVSEDIRSERVMCFARTIQRLCVCTAAAAKSRSSPRLCLLAAAAFTLDDTRAFFASKARIATRASLARRVSCDKSISNTFECVLAKLLSVGRGARQRDGCKLAAT